MSPPAPKSTFRVAMPDWLAGACCAHPPPDSNNRTRMAWLLDILDRHIDKKSGGPFAAAVFLEDTPEPLAVAVNVVVPQCCSLAHAEMGALALAQQRIGCHDLRRAGVCWLFTSCEPCAMCLGAIPWAGIRRLCYAATTDDAQAIGFDEGARPPMWQEELRRRNGISVSPGVLRARARALMQRYAEEGGGTY